MLTSSGGSILAVGDRTSDPVSGTQLSCVTSRRFKLKNYKDADIASVSFQPLRRPGEFKKQRKKVGLVFELCHQMALSPHYYTATVAE